jgi:hypothetical protein
VPAVPELRDGADVEGVLSGATDASTKVAQTRAWINGRSAAVKSEDAGSIPSAGTTIRDDPAERKAVTVEAAEARMRAP